MVSTFFILRTHLYSEADVFVHGLDQRGAKIRLIARSAKKSQKRFGGGVLEPTHLIEGEISEREKDGVRTLTDAKLINGFSGLRENYSRVQTALKVLKWIEKLSLEGVTDSKGLYDLLGHTLTQLTQRDDEMAVYIHFLVRLFLFAGMLPEDPIYAEFARLPMGQHEDLRQSFDRDHLLNRLEHLARGHDLNIGD